MPFSPTTNKELFRAKQIAQCKKDCKERGITIGQWCEENHLSEKSYWYYHKKLGDRLCEAVLLSENAITVPEQKTEFAEIVPNAAAADNRTIATLIIKDMRIELDESISDSFLQRILKAGSNV